MTSLTCPGKPGLTPAEVGRGAVQRKVVITRAQRALPERRGARGRGSLGERATRMAPRSGAWGIRGVV